jgi:oxygen-independent coproporphyrinogen-3 oxidase
MGMRLSEGVDVDRLKNLGGGEVLSKADDLLDQQLLTIENNRLRVTPAGRPILNAVLRALLAD